MAYEKIATHLLAKEGGVNNTNLESTVYKKLSKVLIPRTWGLFKAIECLIELIDMVGELEILEPGGCLTNTNSFRGPLRNALLISICCNLKL